MKTEISNANHSKVNSPETLFSPLYKQKDKSYILLGINAEGIGLHVIHFSIDIFWFSYLFETDETQRPW